MAERFSPVVRAHSRQIQGFTSLRAIDLDALGVFGSPLTVLDDFRVQELPFSAHPHAGFVAVTYVFPDSFGSVRSRTSTGVDVIVGAGGVVWTHAGSGVIHEETPAKLGLELHGLQVFVNLSSSHKLSSPRVLALDALEVPTWESPGARVRVIAGSFGGVRSPLELYEPFTMLDVELTNSLSFEATPGENTVFYVTEGRLHARRADEARNVGEYEAVALYDTAENISLTSSETVRLLILTGRAIDEPLVEEGPFLMNDRAQMEATIARYRSGEMGGLSPL